MEIINPLKGQTNKSWFFEQQVYDSHGVTRAVKAGEGTGNIPKIIEDMEEKKKIELPEELKGKKFRIRKLTPRECFRLMGVSDADIDKIQASGISNSGQYKLAGNSIVAGGNYKDSNGNMDGVLFHLFRKMFIEPGDEDVRGVPKQLSLF